MASCWLGNIQIGGDCPVDVGEELLQLIKEAEVEAQHLGKLPPTPPPLAMLVDPDNGWLCLSDGQAYYGHFEEIENFCQAHDLPYDRACDAYFEFDAETASWRPGMDHEHISITDADGAIVVDYGAVKNAWDALMRGNFTRAMDALAPLIKPELPPLPPFRIV